MLSSQVRTRRSRPLGLKDRRRCCRREGHHSGGDRKDADNGVSGSTGEANQETPMCGPVILFRCDLHTPHADRAAREQKLFLGKHLTRLQQRLQQADEVDAVDADIRRILAER
ncbi:hypothetical protein BC936DRAFT_139454 [Jimgerdemannia flammicorona]|uniref:Uncharacterized protein n=1 Tax=Jimgerdemannia flammicorona TaxID=994334 RepID=A0A433DHS5_9FUNG|nr:hypothetical protein BC936DRAFT_139454 [Jimgerdemannia flammicorona]